MVSYINFFLTKQKLLFSLLFLTLIPWTRFLIFSNKDIEKITSDLRFYEINTCEIPLFQFLANNINVIYQDHYKIVFNSYSSITCFGTITGVDQINDIFYISIGTNVLINIMIVTFFLFLVLQFLKNNSGVTSFNLKTIAISCITSSSLITFGIFSQQKYYSRTLYFYDVTIKSEYLTFFIVFISSSLFLIYLAEIKGENFLNYSPFLFVFIGIVNGMNFSIIILLFLNAGIHYFIKNFYNLRNFTFYYLFLVGIWTLNAREIISNNSYRINPDKTIGIISTELNELSTLYYSILAYFIFLGIKSLVIKSKTNFNVNIFQNSLLNVSSIVLILGILSAHLPLLNFLIFYYTGQHKAGSLEKNVVQYNQWGEFIAWRGFSPSAEIAGELFALTLLVFFINRIQQKKIEVNFFQLVKLTLTFFGLYISNNRAAIFSFVVILSFILLNKFCFQNKLVEAFYKKKFLAILLLFSIFILIYNFSDEYVKGKILLEALNASYQNQISSSLMFFLSEGVIRKFLLTVLSIFAFIINRSMLWGLFISRYNPVPIEFLFGSGPFNFAQLYNEINIKPTSSFLLPHSSILNILLFTGIVNLIIIIFFMIHQLYKKQDKNNLFYIMLIFIIINMIKSDSILYISSFVFYLTILLSNVQNILSQKK
jgi:hypothetical protein